jgi:hypothetical protein
MDSSESSSKPLLVSQVGTTKGVTTLGLVAARMLQEHGTVVFQALATGAVVVVPARELELDGLPEAAALQLLVDEGYTDQQLAAFLEARDSRTARDYRSPAPAPPVESSEDDHR